MPKAKFLVLDNQTDREFIENAPIRTRVYLRCGHWMAIQDILFTKKEDVPEEVLTATKKVITEIWLDQKPCDCELPE